MTMYLIDVFHSYNISDCKFTVYHENYQIKKKYDE